ncbi:hypothetical protein H8959_016066 [Pygathrix nigripes]
MGFTATGIASSSIAAKMMSAAAIANGGGVASGSLVATLQSLGATGLSGLTKFILGSTGSAIAAGIARPTAINDMDKWFHLAAPGKLDIKLSVKRAERVSFALQDPEGSATGEAWALELQPIQEHSPSDSCEPSTLASPPTRRLKGPKGDWSGCSEFVENSGHRKEL